MNGGPSLADQTGPAPRSLARWQFATRTVAVAAAGVVLACAEQRGEGATPVFAIVVVLGLALATAAWPDSQTGLAALGALASYWLVRAGDGVDGWTLLAAAAVTLFHGAIAFSAFLPPTASADPAMLVTWGRRLGVVLAITIAMWLYALVLDGRRPHGATATLVAALIVIGGAALALRRRAQPPAAPPST